MKYLASLLLIFGFGLSAFGQTIKSLGYNTTNGQVVANTGTNVLTFTNVVRFEGDTLNAGVANLNFLNVSDDAFLSYAEFNSGTNLIQINGTGISFGGSSAAATRTNLGFGSGITTNRTFVSYDGTNYTTNTVTISNGIITGWTQ